MLSFVTPARDEVASLPRLLTEIRAAAAGLGGPYEIVVVDDGSTDGSGAWLADEAQRRGDLVVVRFPESRGKGAALAAGLERSRGDILVTLDADLQNDPADAALLIEDLKTHDLACGVRGTRKDTLAKRAASRLSNGFRRLVLRDGFTDTGCALMAWRRPVADRIPKFSGFHRFIPVLAESEGFSVSQRVVNHRERRHGRSHYDNMRRAFRWSFDLLGTAWLRRRRIDTRGEVIGGDTAREADTEQPIRSTR